ncbi:hypothetical protein C8R43DRAFT_1039050 [Mycena crocata]|nr:hypothetical protein C8R43DRAFT_1039050 [Mycena crocata]
MAPMHIYIKGPLRRNFAPLSRKPFDSLTSKIPAMSMSHYRTTSITALSPPRRSTNRLSLISMASQDSSVSSHGYASSATGVVITTTTTTSTFPAPIPPPSAPSLGSDEPLPRPRHGAPPVAPPSPRAERPVKDGVVRKLRRAVGLVDRPKLDPAICEGWD